MAKGFSQQEKEVIVEKLLEKGRELFEKYGMKKTSMSQLTKAVGIAQGSFYLFYSSKEELYFAIMEQEEEQLKREILKHVEEPMSPAAFKNLLIQAIRMIESNPFIQHFFQEEEMEQIIRKLPPEKMESHIKRDTDDLAPLIKYWQQAGSMVMESPEVISGAFRAFIMLAMHKKEIGEAVYRDTLELMADSLAKRLFKEE